VIEKRGMRGETDAPPKDGNMVRGIWYVIGSLRKEALYEYRGRTKLVRREFTAKRGRVRFGQMISPKGVLYILEVHWYPLKACYI